MVLMLMLMWNNFSHQRSALGSRSPKYLATRESRKALPFKGEKGNRSEPKVLIVLNAQRAGGLGGLSRKSSLLEGEPQKGELQKPSL